MQDVEFAANHEIFPIERIGDLLVIMPRGDSMEFSNAAFHAEFNRIKRIASSNDFRNVLVDLSASSYFGSEMIGSLIQLREIVASRGIETAATASDGETTNGETTNGETADSETTGDDESCVVGLCGISSDMAAGLKAMRVDEIFRTFDSKSDAVQTLANQTVSDRVNRLPIPWKSVAIIAVACVLAAVAIFTPVTFMLFGGNAADDYRQVVRIYERWDAKMNQALSPERQVSMGRTYSREIADLRETVRGHDISEAWDKVVEASRQLAIWIDTPTSTMGRENFAEALAVAKYAVEAEEGITLPSPSGLTLPKESDLESTDSEPTSQNTTPAEVAPSIQPEPNEVPQKVLRGTSWPRVDRTDGRKDHARFSGSRRFATPVSDHEGHKEAQRTSAEMLRHNRRPVSRDIPGQRDSVGGIGPRATRGRTAHPTT